MVIVVPSPAAHWSERVSPDEMAALSTVETDFDISELEEPNEPQNELETESQVELALSVHFISKSQKLCCMRWGVYAE
jgi:hypothetical protein